MEKAYKDVELGEVLLGQTNVAVEAVEGRVGSGEHKLALVLLSNGSVVGDSVVSEVHGNDSDGGLQKHNMRNGNIVVRGHSHLEDLGSSLHGEGSDEAAHGLNERSSAYLPQLTHTGCCWH